MGKRKPTSFTIDEEDMARLEGISNNLAINKSRAVSLSINLLHSLMEKSFPEKETEPKTYADVVLSSKMLTPETPETVEVPVVKAKRGWPRGRPRKPVLVLVGRANEQGS